jgi:ApbE superfamily uncharacterized protein (UPF0280 family)
MKQRAQIRMLPDGRRLHLHDGPIDLITEADGTRTAVEQAYKAAANRFVTILDELCAELPLLRAQVLPNSPHPKGPIAQRMYDAVFRSAGFPPDAPPSASEGGLFITPMAAVAGAVAEAVLREMTNAAEFNRAYINNGGDIALHLAPDNSYVIGMVERPESPSLFGSVAISAESSIRGIATSGWRGRSFSLGIADAVTVLAATASAADAAATLIANAVDLPRHPAITRIPANQIAPDSDLLDIPVTRDVGLLSRDEVFQALENGVRVAEAMRDKNLIHSAALCLQGHVRLCCGDGLLRPLPNATSPRFVQSRSLQHA